MAKNNIRKGLVNGLLFGISAVLLGLILYFVDKELFLSPGLRFILSLALPLTFMIKSAMESRKSAGGFITFPEVIQPVYLTFIIGALIYGLFQFVIMSNDYELLVIQKDIAVNSLESIAGFANLSEENVAELREITPEEMRPTFRGFLLGLSKNFILGFVFAVIISLIVKRKNLASEQG